MTPHSSAPCSSAFRSDMLGAAMSDPKAVWPGAAHAASLVENDMVVGLGTGGAAAMFVRALAERLASGLRFRGVPTSEQTARLARELEIPLGSLEEVDILDLDVDGADEVDPELTLIKGHGGALVRERVVASLARRFVVLVGEEKLVPHLGARMAVPVEVVPFAVPTVQRALEAMGAAVELRSGSTGRFVSDNGNPILDARFDPIEHALELERRIDAIPGVVDSGLFVGMADLVLVQNETSFRPLERLRPV